MVDPNRKRAFSKAYAEFAAEQAEYVKQAISALESHQDKGGRWWQYIVSHCTFKLLVGDAPGRGGNVALCFPACEYVRGPTRWPNQQLELTWRCDLDADEWRYTLKDENVGFHLEACLFFWQQNVDLSEIQKLYTGPTDYLDFKPETHMEIRCPYCEHISFGYHPYCCECGKRLTAE